MQGITVGNPSQVATTENKFTCTFYTLKCLSKRSLCSLDYNMRPEMHFDPILLINLYNNSNILKSIVFVTGFNV